MPRQRIYGSPTGPTEGDPQALAFAKRLNGYLLKKGWKQADLVRAAQVHMPAGQAFGRHLISSYIRGAHMPNQVNLEAIAKALGVQATELVPEGSAIVVGHTDQAIKVTMSTNGMARLKLDMELPSDIALQILALTHKAR